MAREGETLPADLPLSEAVHVLESRRHETYPVVDANGRPIGLVSRSDALRWQNEDPAPEQRLGDSI